MRTKLAAAGALTAALIVGGVGGAQVQQGNHTVPSPPGQFTAGWVKIDKTPATADLQLVYCVAYEQGVSCDWADVRKVAAAAARSR